MECDVLISNGTIVDGTGAPAFQADLAVTGDRIEALDPGECRAGEVIDAHGLIVAPGFIDVHSHDDWLLPHDDHPRLMACQLEQGITTIVAGNCGFSPSPIHPGSKAPDLLDMVSLFLSGRRLENRWGDMDAFLTDLEQDGISLNLAQFEGHGTMRVSMFGRDHGPLPETGMAAFESKVDESLEAGAFGLSLGLGYEPGIFTEIDELKRLARRVEKQGGILAVHPRALSRISTAYGSSPFIGPHNLRAIKELIDVAEETGVKLQISHLIFVGRTTWSTADRALEMIERAHERGVDVAFDSYPQTAGNTTIMALFPDWFLKNTEANFQSRLAMTRFRLEWFFGTMLTGFTMKDTRLMMDSNQPDNDGLFFTEIGERLGCSTWDAYMKTARESQGRALCLFYTYSGDETNQDALLKVLAHPLNLFMTDALVTERGLANPGAYGTFPLVIQKCHKELGLLPLEETIARMTGKSAERFGLRDRGVIRPGAMADLTLFDLGAIRDNTTINDTRARPSGIAHVFLNGHRVVRDGLADTAVKAGRVLRRRR